MKKLDSKFVWILFLNNIYGAIFLAIFIGVFLSSFINSVPSFNLPWFGIFIVLLVLFIVFAFVWAKLTLYFYKYELTNDGFKKESGVIYKKYVTIPYDRIQNVDINRGILARILGLSDLNIQTAGNSAVFGGSYAMRGIGAEGRLPGLSKEIANEVRDELIRRAKDTRNLNQGL